MFHNFTYTATIIAPYLSFGSLLPPHTDRYAVYRREFSRQVTYIGLRRGIKIHISNTLHEEFDNQEPSHLEFSETQVCFGKVPLAWLMLNLNRV